jgi:acyl-CoA thioester hydrolase
VTAHLTSRTLFPFWTSDTTRYGDTDRQGHVNNAVFATFCETGRVRLLYQDGGLAPPGCAFVIARLALDFRTELQWNETVDIGTGVTEIRRSSFILGQGLFVGERCAATAENVLVLMDESTRRATPLPDMLRQKLETWRMAL